jgi:hypothetical protein
MLNESTLLFFDSLSASVGDVYPAKPHKWVGRFMFWSVGFGKLLPGECDTVELRKTVDPPHALRAVSAGVEDSVAIFVLLTNSEGYVKVLATDYIPYKVED